MKYFLHDSSAFEDEKIALLFIEYGYEGLGLFYTILEKLAKQEKPINTKVLKMQLKVGKKLEKCWQFMEEIGIISSKDGQTFNKRLLKFNESIDKTRERKAKWISQSRENQQDSENVDDYIESTGRSNLTILNLTKEDTKVSMVTHTEIEPPGPTQKSFKAPSQEDVIDYFNEKYKVTGKVAEAFALKFCSHYESVGWKIGKNKMKNWKAAVTGTWNDTAIEMIKKHQSGSTTTGTQVRRIYLNDQ